MRSIALRFALALSLVVSSAASSAQGLKAGLWETTATITYQQVPFPGMAAAAAHPHTYKVCVTQEQLDKFGAPTQTDRACHLSNVVKSSRGMTADIECTGPINGKGTVKATWTDSSHVTGSSHFVGAFQSPQGGTVPIEWTNSSTSDYKGADCGSVKPQAPSQ